MRPIDADALMEKMVKFQTPHGKLELLVGDNVRNAPTLELPRWIPVSERLPDPFRRVIVARPGEDETIVEQGYRDTGQWWKVYGTRTKQVTHWMPLPEAPKEV